MYTYLAIFAQETDIKGMYSSPIYPYLILFHNYLRNSAQGEGRWIHQKLSCMLTLVHSSPTWTLIYVMLKMKPSLFLKTTYTYPDMLNILWHTIKNLSSQQQCTWNDGLVHHLSNTCHENFYQLPHWRGKIKHPPEPNSLTLKIRLKCPWS